MQMVASLRRLDYAEIIRTRDISPDRADPNSPAFDPEKAAVLHFRAGHTSMRLSGLSSSRSTSAST
jgi:hypothetical protein